MLIDIVKVDVVPKHSLRLRFENGVEGVVDVSKLSEFQGIFAPLADAEYFKQVAIYEEGGTVFWPNGADLDPDVLYSIVSGEKIPEFDPLPSRSDSE